MNDEEEIDYNAIEKEDLTKEGLSYSPWIESYTEDIYEEINNTSEDNEEDTCR